MLNITEEDLVKMINDSIKIGMEAYHMNVILHIIKDINNYLLDLDKREKQIISLTQILDKRISLLEELLTVRNNDKQ